MIGNEYYDEHEREEAIKKWLRENVPVIVVGVVIGLAGVFGWNAWQDHQSGKRGEAAAIYDGIANTPNGDTSTAIEQLKTEYAGTVYASNAALLAASRAALNGNNIEAAISELQWVIDNGSSKALKNLAQLRLARLLLAEGEFERAAELNEPLRDADGFAGPAAVIAGEIALAQGDNDAAREAFQQASGSQLPGQLGQYVSYQLTALTENNDAVAATGERGEEG